MPKTYNMHRKVAKDQYMCVKCNTVKHKNDFYFHRLRTVQSWCKQCMSQRANTRQKENRSRQGHLF